MARSRTYKIEVSYVLAKNGSAVFDDITASSSRVRKKIEQDAAAAGKALEAGLGAGAKGAAKAQGDLSAAAAKAYAQIEAMVAKAAAQEAAQADRAAQAKVRAEQRGFDERLRIAQREANERRRIRERENAEMLREGERIARQQEREAAASARRASRDRAAFASRVASGTLSTTGRLASAAIGFGRQAAEGAGIDFNFGSHIGRAVALEALATDVTNSGYIKGKAGPAGEFQDPAKIANEIRAAADAAKLDTLDVGGGISEFVKRTGDLATARDMMRELAVFAKGTGTSFKDSAAVAAEISNALGDVPNKGEAIMKAMRGLTAEGKLGSIEFSDLAKKFGKLSAASGKFAGEGANEGEKRVDAILKLGAMAQIARATGGADSAAAALTSISSFTNTLTKSSRRKEFKALGIDLEDKQGYFRNPLDIIKDALKATGGDQEKMNKLFMDVQAKRSIDAFAGAYRTAGGGKQGLDAVNAKFGDIFGGAGSMSKEDIEQQAARANGTKASQVQAFNNQLDRIGAQLADQFAPALEKATPDLLRLAAAFADFAGWVAESPKTAILAGIGAAFGKEMLAESLKAAIMGKAGGLSLGTISNATIAVAAATVIYKAITAEKREGVADAGQQIAFNEKVLKAAEDEYNATGTLSEKTLSDLMFQRQEVGKEIKAGASPDYLGAINPFGGTTLKDLGAQQTFESNMGTLTNQAKGIDALLGALEANRLKKGDLDGIKVYVANMPSTPLMSPSDGRVGIDGHGG